MVRAATMVAAVMAVGAGISSSHLYADGAPSPWPEDAQQRSWATQKEPQPRDTPPAPATPASGFYQAPPRTGYQQAASGGYGILGGAFVIPEIRIALPRIELPSVVKLRHPARMFVNPAEAMWVSTGAAPATTPAAPRSTPEQAGESRGVRATIDPEIRALRQQYHEKLDELNRRLEECDELRRKMERTLEGYSRREPLQPADRNLGIPRSSGLPFAPSPIVGHGQQHPTAPNEVRPQADGWPSSISSRRWASNASR